MLILYPATLLNSFISTSSFCAESLGFSVYSIISPAYNDNFTSFNLIPFVSFSCPIAVGRNSNTNLNRRGESGHPCLVPDFRGKAFSFSVLSTILAVGLSSLVSLNMAQVYTAQPFTKAVMETEAPEPKSTERIKKSQYMAVGKE